MIDKVFIIFYGQRSGEQISLPFRASGISQDIELCLGLYTFAYNIVAKTADHIHQFLQEEDSSGTGFTVLDKSSVQLHCIHRNIDYRIQYGITGSEIIHGSMNPGFAKLPEPASGALVFFYSSSLGQFYFRVSGIDLIFFQNTEIFLHGVGIGGMQYGSVYGNRNLFSAQLLIACKEFRHTFKYIEIKVFNITAGFAQRYEGCRRQQPSVFRVPAYQRFRADYLACCQRYLGLQINLEPVFLKRFVNAVNDLVFQFLPLFQILVVDLHGDGRIMTDMFPGIIGRVDSERSADTVRFDKIDSCAEAYSRSLELICLKMHEFLIKSVCSLYQFPGIRIGDQHQKLVGNNPGKETQFFQSHFFEEKVRIFFQKLIAHTVAAFLVEIFETFEIAVQHGV